MVDLSRAYDRAFFAEYSADAPEYAASCALIAGEIHRRYTPASVVDWGCGAGLHLKEMASRGSDTLGIDGSRVAVELVAPPVRVRCADITKLVRLDARFDLALCIDVLEHIEEQYAEAVLRNVVASADMVILSCAPPNQGGHHHVNEQPRRYWVKEMAALGWEYQRKETSDLEGAFLAQRDRIAHTWMFHNLCIYLPVPGGRRIRQAYTR